MNTTVPALCLHGFTGGPASFESLGLDSDPCVYLAGHGAIPDCSSPDFASELKRILALLTTPRHLVGYSMGARVALGLALEAPALFRSVTLIGANPGLQSEEERAKRVKWEDRWCELLENEGIEEFERHWSRQPIFSDQLRMPVEAQREQRAQRLAHTATGLAHAMSKLGLGRMPNYWERLSSMKVPSLWVAGSEDEKFLSIAKRASSRCASSRVLAVPLAGHNPLLEVSASLRANVHAFHTSIQ